MKKEIYMIIGLISAIFAGGTDGTLNAWLVLLLSTMMFCFYKVATYEQ